MTQQELADYLGLRNRSQVCHLESGRTVASGPKLRMLQTLASEIEKKISKFSAKSSKSC